MNWVQKNPFLTAFIGATLLFTAAAAYFTATAFGRFTEVSDQYDAAVSRLHGLQNRTPFPSEENLATYAKLTETYDAKFGELSNVIAKRQSALEPISPQAFQDNLRAVVSAVIELASENTVELPEGFYMGFDQYRGTLPSDTAAPILAEQLAGIQSIITNLIKLRVTAITGLSRMSLAAEGGAPQPESPRQQQNQQPAQPAEPILVSKPIDIAFRAEQGKVRQALNGIVTAERIFIIRSITIQNTQLEGPPRQADSAAAAPDPNANAFAEMLGNQGQLAGTPKTSLSVIVGRELVNVNTRIEMIGFNLPAIKE
jgi:hypothetical protein